MKRIFYKRTVNWVVVFSVFAAILAVVGTLRVYPFIGLADGFSRWNLAVELCNTGKITTETLLSPMISLFQAATYYLTESYGLYTIIQAYFFYLATGLLFYLMLKDIMVYKFPAWFLLALITLFVPTFRIFPLMLTDSAPVFILLTFMLYLLTSGCELSKIGGGTLLILLIVFLTVAIRVNSLVLFSLITLFLLFTLKKNKTLCLTIAVITGMILGVLVPKQMLPNNSNASSLGMIWELVSIEKETGDPVLFDQLSEFGDVAEAENRWNPEYLNAVVWDNNPPFYAIDIAQTENAKAITKIYLKTFLRMPSEFIKNKLSYICRTLGVSDNLITSARGVHGIDDITQGYGGMVTQIQESDRSSFIEFTDRFSILTLKPWTLVTIMLCLLLISKILFNTDGTVFTLTWAIAVGYYLSFCINTQAMEYRYYAPSFYLLYIGTICLIVTICNQIVIKREK